MRYLIGFVLALGLTISPVSSGAQEPREPGGWLKSELAYLKCPTFRRADGILVATFDEPIQGAPKGRLDNFYPGTPPERTFDKERLDDFYPEEARVELEYINSAGAPESSQRTGISKGGKIAIGVLVPVIVVSIGLGVGVAVSLNRNPIFGD